MNIKLNYYELETLHVAITNDYAAVSILIFDKKEIVYIKRSNEMPTHKGQIAFPGGKREEKDIDIVSTAVRESTEELLLSESTIKPFGYLNSIDTVEYKFDVYPIVCQLLEKPKNFNVSEVQEVFFVEIKKLSNPNNWSYRGTYPDDWIFMIGKEILWGATAKITRRLLNLDLRQTI